MSRQSHHAFDEILGQNYMYYLFICAKSDCKVGNDLVMPATVDLKHFMVSCTSGAEKNICILQYPVSCSFISYKNNTKGFHMK